MSTAAATVIADADWLGGFDGTSHRLIRGGTVAFCGNTITFVGRGYGGAAETTVDGRGRIVGVAGRDWAGRTHEEMAPRSFPRWEPSGTDRST